MVKNRQVGLLRKSGSRVEEKVFQGKLRKLRGQVIGRITNKNIRIIKGLTEIVRRNNSEASSQNFQGRWKKII